MTPLLPSPSVLGAPEKFDRWRRRQDEALLSIDSAPERFVLQVQPTGFGKSLVYIVLGLLQGGRTAILTRTKALQRQLMDDFESVGLVDVRGANAYRCLALEPGGEHHDLCRPDRGQSKYPGCDEGPCRAEVPCSLKSHGCEYYDAVRAGSGAKVLVTNYAYWMSAHRASVRDPYPLGRFTHLVLDEAHGAPDALSDFLTVELTGWDFERLETDPLDDGVDPDEWRLWAGHHAARVGERVSELGGSIKTARQENERIPRQVLREYRELMQLESKLDMVSHVTDEWVCRPDGQGPRHWHFTPAWPAPFGESVLFLRVPKVVLVSATVRLETAKYLGADLANARVVEYPSAFDPDRRPVYYLPLVRVDMRMSDGDRRRWLAGIDNILRARLDRKGIIHTVSYARAREIVMNSQFRDSMIMHSPSDTRLAIRKYLAAPPPAFLVSPSVTTGYDFPDDACRFIVCAKVPYPDSRDPVLKIREQADPEYRYYVTLQTLVQECGRAMRSERDWSEVFIVDAHFGYLIRRYQHLVPRWFLEAVRRPGILPSPPALDGGPTTRA